MEKLTNENYFSQEMNMEYMSSTQFKSFMDCENHALAVLKGDYIPQKTEALLLGGYIDAYFSNELIDFMERNPEIYDARKKEKVVRQAFLDQTTEIIKAIEHDPLMMKYLNGKHQQVMTGVINGVKFKIKVDSLLDNCIVDQKIMASISELTWVYDEETKRNKQVDFVEAQGYAIQGAIYQEVVRQNLGKKLPFILAVCTKEEEPDKALIQIDQCYLDKALKLVEELAPRYDLIKKGIVEPNECGKCPTCRKDKVCTEVVSYKALFGKEDNNEKQD